MPIRCPKCGDGKFVRHEREIKGERVVDRYDCGKCGYMWAIRIEPKPVTELKGWG